LKVICIVQGNTVPATVKQISTGKTKGVIGQVFGSSTQWFLPRFGLIKSQEESSYILVNGATIRLPRGVIAGDLQLANYFAAP
jgi:hypothetical protein